MRLIATAVSALSLMAGYAEAEILFDWQRIANAGNAADTNGLGRVDYEFNLAQDAVTYSQYAAFLNATAKSDPNALYNPQMAIHQAGGIARSGTDGSFSYSVQAGREDHPALFVNFFSAMRFTNWLHNGQGSGGTESGVYDIQDGFAETRSADARYFLPSENEWYKAAYYQPATSGGDGDNYWLYPTSSNTEPIADIEATIARNIASGDTTPVGSYPSNYFGINDMAGNAMEWTEGLLSATQQRVAWGGTWYTLSNSTAATSGGIVQSPQSGDFANGFRVAAPIPNSATAALLIAAVPFVQRRRR